MTSVINAKENRFVATCDIPGAFMQADMDELLHIKLEGDMALLLAKVDPDRYNKYIRYVNGKPVIYVMLCKALCGTLQAALLFWKNLSSFLIDELGFVLNPYDKCVANKMINGKQCTILWHVDDLKISHESKEVLDKIIAMLNKKYSTKDLGLTVTHGKVHEYLGMTIDYSTPGKVKFYMHDYVENVIEAAPDDMNGFAVTPATSRLFDIDNHSEYLSDKDAEIYHHLTAKLLYLGKRARPDIQTAVAFLCTRVMAPSQDDWKKLGRCIRYLRKVPRLPLVLEAGNDFVLRWWVDASFAVHRDMRSHTGVTMNMGRGSIYSSSTRQKINTKSSTEAELVGVDDAMAIIIWMRHFLEAQGYNVTDNIVYQDNQSAMLLEKNGRGSSGKRTRHINIRYFFVTDKIVNKEVRVVYCPTEAMIADYFTKPLQGKLFRTMRYWIMNSVPEDENPGGTQECVGTPSWEEAINSSPKVLRGAPPPVIPGGVMKGRSLGQHRHMTNHNARHNDVAIANSLYDRVLSRTRNR